MLKAITRGIQVEVELFYRPDRSETLNSQHFFEYQIYIKNKSSEKVKLLSRRWEILSSPSMKKIIEGNGVIGEQPELEPRHRHSYSSYVVINDTVGLMEGIYIFENMVTGEQFHVDIPTMNLIVPSILN